MEKSNKLINKSSSVIDVVKGVIFSLAISMILIVIFAIIIRFVNIGDALIMPINQVIKGVSLFFGVWLALRGTNKGLIKGAIIGALFSVLSYIVFSILSSSLSFGFSTITDLLFNLIFGAISGLIVVNISKK